MNKVILGKDDLIELEVQVNTTIRNLKQLQEQLGYDFEDTIHNLRGLLDLAIQDSQAYYAKPSQNELDDVRANELQELAEVY